MDLFKTPGNRKRIRIIFAIAVFSQWLGNGLFSCYLERVLNGIDITSPNQQTLINGIISIYNFAIAVTASMVVERIGRRKLFLASNAGMVVETKGRSLEETATLFDGEDVAAELEGRTMGRVAEEGRGSIQDKDKGTTSGEFGSYGQNELSR
ncbi:hypothetical protein FRC07_002355 [Ceratobasidium sp. 392]|nr:hypothetical protein FRC07_002355 [Ceratobasidium sp. 392]